MANKILIADDEKGITNPLVYAFRREGFEVEAAYDGDEALEKIKSFKPHVVLLDINMPKLTGFEILKKVSSSHKIGIIFLTAKNDISDRVIGLELGADDYITKPFDIREVIARVNSLLRRLNSKKLIDEDYVESGKIKIYKNDRIVTIDDKNIDLSPKEFDLLYMFLSNPGRLYSRENILNLIWDIEYVANSRTVDIHVQRLRKKLGKENEHIIQTIHGIGYKGIKQ